MNDKVSKAFDFAQDSVKQLIALATGIIALTVTFLTDLTQDAPSEARAILASAWLLYFISVVAGILTLLNLTGNLEKASQPSIYSKGIVAFAAVQILTFGAALLLTLWFGVLAPSFPTPYRPT